MDDSSITSEVFSLYRKMVLRKSMNGFNATKKIAMR